MPTYYLTAMLLGAAIASATPSIFKRDYFGPAVYTGPTGADIIYTSTVLVPGRNPGNKQSGFLTIWPGMSNGTGDLVQSTLDSTNLQVEDCGATADQWCAMGSLFGNDATGNPRQLNGPMKPVSPNDRVRIEYIRGAAKDNGYEWDWTQMVSNEATGEYISSLVSVSGTMRGWGTATECHADCDATIDTHYYYDTKIVLEKGSMSYGNTIGAGGDASFSDFTPNEDGSVWTIAKITIPAMNKNSPSGDQGIAGYVAPAGNSAAISVIAAQVTSASAASISTAAVTRTSNSAITAPLCVSSAAVTVTKTQTVTKAAVTLTQTQVRTVAATKTVTQTVTSRRRSLPTTV